MVTDITDGKLKLEISISSLGLCWVISASWELTEIAFVHLLPSYQLCECWWDTTILDLFLCNGSGILVGMLLIQWLDIPEYPWDAIQANSSTTHYDGKGTATGGNALQLTTATSTSVSIRPIVFFAVVLINQVIDLNTFFAIQVFSLPKEHPIVLLRLVFFLLMSAPAAR